MAISTQVALEHLIFKWQRIAQEKPSDNMIYHAPTIRAFLVDLRVIAESNPEPSLCPGEDLRDCSAPNDKEQPEGPVAASMTSNAQTVLSISWSKPVPRLR